MDEAAVPGINGYMADPAALLEQHEVANRHAPRVMLSDEVGPGETIEACLILHRLLLSGRANRILVLVPESLVHQWFVEMLRRADVALVALAGFMRVLKSPMLSAAHSARRIPVLSKRETSA